MGWFDEVRRRNELATERLVKHPFLAWLGHAIMFAALSIVLQATSSGPVDVVRAVIMGALIATAVVGGSIARYHVRRSRKR